MQVVIGRRWKNFGNLTRRERGGNPDVHGAFRVEVKHRSFHADGVELAREMKGARLPKRKGAANERRKVDDFIGCLIPANRFAIGSLQNGEGSPLVDFEITFEDLLGKTGLRLLLLVSSGSRMPVIHDVGFVSRDPVLETVVLITHDDFPALNLNASVCGSIGLGNLDCGFFSKGALLDDAVFEMNLEFTGG